jgi:hypothetical protein
METFGEQTDSAVLEQYERYKQYMFPLLRQTVACNASCFETSPNLQSALKCLEPCGKELMRLTASLGPWTKLYLTNLGECKKVCKGKGKECKTTCINERKHNEKLIADLDFIMKGFFTDNPFHKTID